MRSSESPPVAFTASDTPLNTTSASFKVPPDPRTDADNCVNCFVASNIGTFNSSDTLLIIVNA